MTFNSSGLTIQTQPEIYDEIKGIIESSPNLNPRGRINLTRDSVLGVLISIVADKLAEMQQLVQAVYSSQYVATAEGSNLDNLVALLGITRLPATSSTATLTATGVNGTVITAGSLIRDPDRTSIEWVVMANATISGGTATLSVQCATTGPIAANTGTLTEIVTPIVGFNTVTNAADAELGLNEETDEALRIRFNELLFTPGSSTLGSIRAALLVVSGVTEAYVYENMQNNTNAFGVPGKSIECVVVGGSDNAIAQAIMDNKAAGIGTYSATSNSGTAVDTNSQNQIIEFSRPVNVNCYIYIEIISDGSNVTVSSELQSALVAFGDTYTVGSKIVRSKFINEAYKIQGVANVRRLAISRTGQPTSGSPTADFLTDITMAFRENASFDSSRCVVAIVTE